MRQMFLEKIIHKTGASATIMIGDAGLAEYNNIYDTGHLQVRCDSIYGRPARWSNMQI